MMFLMQRVPKSITWKMLIGVFVLLLLMILFFLRRSQLEYQDTRRQRASFRNANGVFEHAFIRVNALEGYAGKELVILGELKEIEAGGKSITLSPAPAGSVVRISVPQNDFQLALLKPSKDISQASESRLIRSNELERVLQSSLGKMIKVKILFDLEDSEEKKIRSFCKPAVCSLIDMWGFYRKNNRSYVDDPTKEMLMIGPLTQVQLDNKP